MHACRHLSGTCLPTHARVWVPLNRHEDNKGQKSPQAHNCSIRPDAATYLLGSTPRPICYYYLLSRLGSTPRLGTQTNDPDAHGWGVLPGQTYAKHKQ